MSAKRTRHAPKPLFLQCEKLGGQPAGQGVDNQLALILEKGGQPANSPAYIYISIYIHGDIYIYMPLSPSIILNDSASLWFCCFSPCPCTSHFSLFFSSLAVNLAMERSISTYVSFSSVSLSSPCFSKGVFHSFESAGKFPTSPSPSPKQDRR